MISTGKRFLVPLLVLALMLAIIVPGTVSAGTTIQGKIWRIQLDLSPDTYTPYSGDLKTGEQTAFSLSSNEPIDVFVFDQAQYDQYTNTGIDTPGYSGPAAFSVLGTTHVEKLLTAPANGTYYLVIDNTPAGNDLGTTSKSVFLEIVYPLTAIVTTSYGLLWAMLLVFALIFLPLVIFSAIGRKG